jgi:hypothetical protein
MRPEASRTSVCVIGPMLPMYMSQAASRSPS